MKFKKSIPVLRKVVTVINFPKNVFILTIKYDDNLCLKKSLIPVKSGL